MGTGIICDSAPNNRPQDWAVAVPTLAGPCAFSLANIRIAA